MLVMVFVTYLCFICDGIRIFYDGFIVFFVFVFSAGLPHCFYITHKSFLKTVVGLGLFL